MCYKIASEHLEFISPKIIFLMMKLLNDMSCKLSLVADVHIIGVFTQVPNKDKSIFLQVFYSNSYYGKVY